MTKLRIVFMGTPAFAVGILDTLVKNNYEIAGVITAADKPAGRGQKITYSGVKEYALQQQLPLLQPTNLKAIDFLSQLQALQANVYVVVAFRMLPKAVWQLPALGTFNLHASLLPNYRGAAPINWAIINGETETGVTTFFIDDTIDTGAMILQEKTTIGNSESAGQLHDKLMVLGSKIVIDTLTLIEKGAANTTEQKETAHHKTAHKLHKENCKIDWTKSAPEIYNLIRGLSPYPAAWSMLRDANEEWNIKIYDAALILEDHSLPIGQVLCTKKEMKIAVKKGFIQILCLQLPGKKKMTAAELLNGICFSENASVF